MTGFALQIDLVDGGEYHVFGRTEQQRAEFERMSAGWRAQPPSAYYTFVDNDDSSRRIYRRDIADVRTVGL